MLSKIFVRDLLQTPPLQLQATLPPKFILVMEDGEVATTRRRTVVSAYFWEYHRVYPKTPMLLKHHIQHLIAKGSYNSDTHTKLCEAIEKDVFRIYEEEDEDIVTRTARIAFDASIRMTNEMMSVLSPYVSPFDLLNGIQINRHPSLQQAFRVAVPTGESVRTVYGVTKDTIMNDKSLDHNGLARAYRNNTVKREQVLQTVAFRGVPTEPDGTLYRQAITTGYLEGMTRVYDFISDSRSAPKALMSTEAPLRDSEYMARRLQFLVSVVRSIKGKDCGSKNLLRWYIDPEVFDDDGSLISVGGIGAMEGKFVELEENPGQLVELSGKEAHLNGKYVRMRSVLGCQNKDPHTVCKTCFGGLYRNYFPHQNLGHLCCVTITEKITQNTLGTKHLVATGQGARIQLTPTSSQFFSIGASKVDYVMKPHFKKFQTTVVIPRTDAISLADVMKMETLDDLTLNHISYLTDIMITHRDKGVTMSDIVSVNQGNRKAFMTLPFIKHIRKHGFTVTETNDFSINLAEWDYTKSMFSVSQMEVSYSEHGQEVSKLVESNLQALDEREKPESPLKTLQELSTLVNSKLDIKLSCLEVIIYASMVPSRSNSSMARGFKNPVLGVARSTISGRSLSCAYSFQGHSDFMLSGRSFFPHGRVSSDMDVFFNPEACVRESIRLACE